MQSVSRFSRISFVTGNIAMLAGAIDPLEGSIVILLGGGLILFGTYFGNVTRRFLILRIWVFILLIAGVAALWGLSALGGFGGTSELSNWWGLLILPYPIGWFMGIWAPDSPRWVLWSGIGVGVWYLAMPILLTMIRDTVQLEELGIAVIVLGATGILIITGCIMRLRKSNVIASH